MPETEKPMHITRFEAIDFKRLRAIDITPTQVGLVLIKGHNEAGKTSILTAIIAALSGKAADPPLPIRHGAASATATLTLSDHLAPRYRVSVRWATSKTPGAAPTPRYLTLTDLSGSAPAVVSSPQTALRGLVGALSFDPLAFAREPRPERRLHMLIDAAGVADAYATKKAQVAAAEETRRTANTEAKVAQQAADSSPDPSPTETLTLPPADAATKLTTRLKEATDHNTAQTTLQARITHAKADTARIEQSCHALELRQAEVARELDTAHAALAASQRTTSDLTASRLATIDTEPITSALAALGTLAARAQAQLDARQAQTAAAAAVAAAARADRDLQVRRAELSAVVTDSPLAAKIPGLAIDHAGQISLANIPLEQASGEQRLLLSATIARLANPDLRVMCIDEGDTLDQQHVDQLAKLASDEAYQIWMTTTWAAAPDNADGATIPSLPVQADPPEITL